MRKSNAFATQEVTAEELESAKQTVLNGFIFNFDTPAKTLNRLLTYRYYGYPDDFIFQYQKAVQQVTRARNPPRRETISRSFEIRHCRRRESEGVSGLRSLRSASRSVTSISPFRSRSVPRPRLQPVRHSRKAAQLLAKMAEAMGGEAKLSAVKDITEKAELNLDPAAGGLKATQTELWLASGHYREENALPFGKVMTYSDGKTGWVSSPQGVMPIPEPERKQVSFEIFRMWFPLLASATDPDRKLDDEGNGAIHISDKAGNSLVLTDRPEDGPACERELLRGRLKWPGCHGSL